MISTQDYTGELAKLAEDLLPVYHRMQKKNQGTAFGDFEGEVLYRLIREKKPRVVWEISPNAGYSTNYILAAMKANGGGVCHSFELIEEIGGIPIEKVIRGNLISGLGDYLEVHVGDVTKILAPELNLHSRGRNSFDLSTELDECDFLLLDSCHEAWFADWYIERLFPLVRGTVFIQDIAFRDRLENSGEAAVVWKWIQRNRLAVQLVGQMDRGERFRERWDLESNSVFFSWPNPKNGTAILWPGVQDQIGAHLFDDAIQTLLHRPDIANRHRLFREIGKHTDQDRCRQRAFGSIFGRRSDYRKGLVELAASLDPWIAPRAWLLMVLEPGLWAKGARAFLDALAHAVYRKIRWWVTLKSGVVGHFGKGPKNGVR